VRSRCGRGPIRVNLYLIFSVLAERLPGKSVSEITYLVLSGTSNLNSIKFYLIPLLLCIPGTSLNTADRRHLVIPVFNILCPCLPSSIRRRLHCGIEHDSDLDGDDCFTCTQVRVSPQTEFANFVLSEGVSHEMTNISV